MATELNIVSGAFTCPCAGGANAPQSTTVAEKNKNSFSLYLLSHLLHSVSLSTFFSSAYLPVHEGWLLDQMPFA